MDIWNSVILMMAYINKIQLVLMHKFSILVDTVLISYDHLNKNKLCPV